MIASTEGPKDIKIDTGSAEENAVAADGGTAETPAKSGKSGKKKRAMPSAYVIVFAVLIIVAALTYFIPVSVHDPATGEAVYNAIIDEDGNLIRDAGPQPYGLWDIFMAPVKGFEDAGSVSIALLMAGGFLFVLNTTGGLEAAIGRLLRRLKGKTLIALMTLVSALMGTVFGFWEEILAFSLVIIPMFVMAGYDVMMGLAVLFIGATVGNMADVVNPFATGAAVAAIGDPNMTMGSGIVLRILIFAVLYAVAALFLIRYGAKIKADPKRSALHGVEGIKALPDDPEPTGGELKPRHAASVILFIVMIALLVIGYIPWADLGGEGLSAIVNAPFRALANVPVLGDILGAGHMTPLGSWGFDEFSVLFFTGAVLLMIINRLKVDEFIKNFLLGAKDLLGVVIVLSIARGIAVIMGDSEQGMSVTLVYWISDALSGVPHWTFAFFAVGAYMLIGLALQSTSGVAGISMPILGAVAAALFSSEPIGATGGEIILISAFTIGLNFMGLIYPTAVNLGTLELFNVPYGHYLKFMLKCGLPLLLVATALLTLAAYLGLVF